MAMILGLAIDPMSGQASDRRGRRCACNCRGRQAPGDLAERRSPQHRPKRNTKGNRLGRARVDSAPDRGDLEPDFQRHQWRCLRVAKRMAGMGGDARRKGRPRRTAQRFGQRSPQNITSRVATCAHSSDGAISRPISRLLMARRQALLPSSALSSFARQDSTPPWMEAFSAALPSFIDRKLLPPAHA
jgi:hypothetical protein